MTTYDLISSTSYSNKDSILNNLQKYGIANCLNKRPTRVFDPIAGQFVMRDIPCGRCVHCRTTKMNEWYSRLAMHLHFNPYCYFVTLTFRSPSSKPIDFTLDAFGHEQYYELTYAKYQNKALLDMHKRADSIMVYNDINQEHKKQLNIGVSNEKIFQNFFKKLRLKVDNLSYFYCTEYGHKYGKLHAHMLLFCKQPILEDDVKQAWSRRYCLKNGQIIPYRGHKLKDVFDVPFGHVDFEDITQSIEAGERPKCFKYVTKYLQKDEFNDKQVYGAWCKLPTLEQPDGSFVKYVGTPAKDKISNLLTYYYKSYEKGKVKWSRTDSERACEVACHVLPEHECCSSNYREFEDYFQFKQAYKPYHRVSVGNPLGSEFADLRLESFKEKNFSILADSSDSAVVFPRYYLERTKRAVLPLRLKESLSGSTSYSVGAIPCIIEYLRQICARHDSLFDGSKSTEDEWPIFSKTRDIERSLLFYDFNNKTTYRPHYSGNYVYYTIEKYNRSKRCFDVLDQISVKEFYEYYKRYAEDYIRFMSDFRLMAEKNDKAWNEYKKRCEACGVDFDDLLCEADLSLQKTHADAQRLYNLKHQHLET